MRISLLMSLCLLACSAPEPDLTRPPLGERADDLLAAAAAVSTWEPAATQDHWAGFRILYGKTACRSAIRGQGAPIVRCEQRPIAGQSHQVVWTVNPSAPFDNTRAAWLLVWFDEAAPTELTPFGHDGCTLWAPLDPKRLRSLFPAPNTFLTQDGGRILLRWVPPADWVGRKVYCQLVVVSPGANDAGWLLSPGLQLEVGSK